MDAVEAEAVVMLESMGGKVTREQMRQVRRSLILKYAPVKRRCDHTDDGLHGDVIEWTNERLMSDEWLDHFADLVQDLRRTKARREARASAKIAATLDAEIARCAAVAAALERAPVVAPHASTPFFSIGDAVDVRDAATGLWMKGEVVACGLGCCSVRERANMPLEDVRAHMPCHQTLADGSNVSCDLAAGHAGEHRHVGAVRKRFRTATTSFDDADAVVDAFCDELAPLLASRTRNAATIRDYCTAMRKIMRGDHGNIRAPNVDINFVDNLFEYLNGIGPMPQLRPDMYTDYPLPGKCSYRVTLNRRN